MTERPDFAPYTLGRRAYLAYAATTGHLTHDGRDMPHWDALTEIIRGAWEAAAQEAVNHASIATAQDVRVELIQIEPVPYINGKCPACGGRSLYLAAGDHITCSRKACPNPTQLNDQINQDTE